MAEAETLASYKSHRRAASLQQQETQFHDVVARPLSAPVSPATSEKLARKARVRYENDELPSADLNEEQQEQKIREYVERVSKQSRPFLMLKIVQFIFSTLILPMAVYTWPVMLVRGNIHIAMQPLVACSTYIMYCPLVFFGYLAHINTPAAVMLSVDMLGMVYFTVAAAMFGVYWADLRWLLAQTHVSDPPLMELEHIKMALEASGVDDPDLYLAADRLLMLCLLSCSAATTFIGDVFLTMKYLVFRKLPIVYKHRPL